MRYLSTIWAWTISLGILISAAGSALAAESTPTQLQDLKRSLQEQSAQVTSQQVTSQKDSATAPSQQSIAQAPNAGYWREAARLIQAQILLVDRADRAFSGPDANQVRAVEGQILLHVSAVERFQRTYFPGQPASCATASSAASSDPASQTLCALTTNAKTLQSLRPKLYERLEMLATIGEVKPLPLVSGERSLRPGGIPTFERGNLRTPAVPLTTRIPYMPPTDRPVLGRPMKSALGDYVPPVPPAIAPPQGVPETIDQMRSRLGTAEEAFPRKLTFRDPRETRSQADRNAYEVASTERSAYQKFLAKPHTGISRVLSAATYHPDPNGLRNRLDPTIEERYPYAILIQPNDPPLPRLAPGLRGRLAPFDTQRAPFVPLSQTSFRPRLALQVDGDKIRNVMQSGLDYGFMYDLGTDLKGLDLNSVSAGLMPEQLGIRDDVRRMFLDYQPPKQLETLLSERRRFLSGKTGPNNLPSILSPQAALDLNHTYVLRSFQFKVPEPIATGRPIKSTERKNIKQLLEMPSSDVLVVFRPIAKRADGSYTILWRVLGEFSAPQVTDLDQHVSFKN